MKEYLERLQPENSVVHHFERSGETVDCVAVDEPRDSKNEPPVIVEPVTKTPGRSRPLLLKDAFFRGDFDGQGHKRECPQGTFGRHRWNIEDLKRFGSLESWLSGGKIGSPTDPGVSGSGHSYAFYRQDVTNWGIAASFQVWKPFTGSSSDLSLAQLWESRGGQTIESGFIVYGDKYGNFNTHWFIFTTKDSYHSTLGKCWDSQCTQFNTQYNSVMFHALNGACLGCSINPTSVTGDPNQQYHIDLTLRKTSTTGDWYLYWFGTPVGYFPAVTFSETGLIASGNRITVGGETAQAPGVPYHALDMGNGFKPPAFGDTYASRISWFQGFPISGGPSFRPTTYSYMSNANCYNLADASDSSQVGFYYGGIGGADPACTGNVP